MCTHCVNTYLNQALTKCVKLPEDVHLGETKLAFSWRCLDLVFHVIEGFLVVLKQIGAHIDPGKCILQRQIPNPVHTVICQVAFTGFHHLVRDLQCHLLNVIIL